MSVVLETTVGDITIDLYTTQRPKACMNFLKLCKMKYYNYNLFHTIQHDFLAQTGDPTGSGTGGESIWGVISGTPLQRYFQGEDQPKLQHTQVGQVSLVSIGDHMLGAQFFITLAPHLQSLDQTHCVIGEVAEGFDTLRKLNEAICDEDHRPYQDIRITHTVVLEDPYPDPERFVTPDQSPPPSAERLQGGRIGADEEIDETVGKTPQELAELAAEREAKARATILEMVGDIPDAEMAPPENVLFVCKLNPVTSDDDLEIIFSRFGKINSCEVIRDKQTGDSLQYAFVEFDEQKACEEAYFKMDNVLIDDRRIHVDFSQSVAKIRWLGKGRGVQHLQPKDERRRERESPARKPRQDHSRSYKRPHHESSRYKSHDHQPREYRSRRNHDRNDTRYSKSESDKYKREDTKYRDAPKKKKHRKHHSSSEEDTSDSEERKRKKKKRSDDKKEKHKRH